MTEVMYKYWMTILMRIESAIRKHGRGEMMPAAYKTEKRTIGYAECSRILTTIKKDLSVCPQCQSVHDRDVNAAINIRQQALQNISI